jgi:hypothetical protein
MTINDLPNTSPEIRAIGVRCDETPRDRHFSLLDSLFPFSLSNAPGKWKKPAGLLRQLALFN